jgi:hypothetical protein
MAIIVEEEKKKSNIIGVVAWIAFFVIVGTAIYYIFFAAPVATVPTATGNLSTLAPLASTTLQPQNLVNTPAFVALHSPIPNPTPQGPVSVGRQNPFIAP